MRSARHIHERTYTVFASRGPTPTPKKGPHQYLGEGVRDNHAEIFGRQVAIATLNNLILWRPSPWI